MRKKITCRVPYSHGGKYKEIDFSQDFGSFRE